MWPSWRLGGRVARSATVSTHSRGEGSTTGARAPLAGEIVAMWVAHFQELDLCRSGNHHAERDAYGGLRSARRNHHEGYSSGSSVRLPSRYQRSSLASDQ